MGKLDDDHFAQVNFDWKSKIDQKLINFYTPDDWKNIHSSAELKNKLKNFIGLDMDTSVDSNVNYDTSGGEPS
jgi:hypothetical protein